MKLVTQNEKAWLDNNANSTPTPIVFGTIVTANQSADVVAITDSSTGTSGGNTIAAITTPALSAWNGSSVFPSAADSTAITAAITAIKNGIATNAAKLNAIRAALVAAGIML